MIFVLAILALGLAYAGWKNKPNRAALLGFALINLIGVVVLVVEDPPYAYSLKQHNTAPGID